VTVSRDTWDETVRDVSPATLAIHLSLETDADQKEASNVTLEEVICLCLILPRVGAIAKIMSRDQSVDLVSQTHFTYHQTILKAVYLASVWE